MDTKTQNPRRVSLTSRMVDHRKRQGERWRRMEMAALRERERMLMDSDAAWRRWTDSDCPEVL